MSAEEIANALELSQITSHVWHVQHATATEGTGLEDGFEWLAQKIAETM
eukprot:TRINITY_DN17118_c0_g2_i1.p1 TRINITY_DN17118_c0_g2~~TRINITY_DN17118_c0_g2_i1.p1  ORF type:complete len:59 (-),score=23.12 TRINITY_DN17118_c0_g2_i1:249-395(-)